MANIDADNCVDILPYALTVGSPFLRTCALVVVFVFERDEDPDILVRAAARARRAAALSAAGDRSTRRRARRWRSFGR